MPAGINGSPEVVAKYPNLRPFAKGVRDPRQGNGLDAKTRRARKKLAKLDDKAIQRLGEMLDSRDANDVRFAVGFWGKYRLPVPGDKLATASDPIENAVVPSELAARLAALDS